jgi:tetratricopeptide (TPR) repeat protein
MTRRFNHNLSQLDRFNQLMYQGSVRQNKGDIEGSYKIFKLAQKIFPNHPDVFNRIGLYHWQKKEWQTAIDFITKAININPTNAEYTINRSACLVKLKRYNEAELDCRSSIENDPNQIEAWNNLAMILVELEKLDEAHTALLKYMKHSGDSEVANFNMGVFLQVRGRHEESFPYYHRCIEISGEGYHGVNSRINIANGYKELSEWAIADQWVEEAIRIDPKNGEAWNLKGGILKEIGKPNKSIDCFNNAANLLPEKASEFIYNRSLSEILIGRLPQGWMDYEHRFSVISKAPAFAEYMPWQGEPLGNGTLILHREQGMGDTIQFCRYIPLIKRQYPESTIVVVCEPSLYDLMETLEGIDQVLRWDDSEVAVTLTWNYHCPILSLPWVFKTTRETIPAQEVIPYFNPDIERVNYWNNKFDKNKINIGLVWSGGIHAENPKVWATNHRRNCDFSYFQGLINSITTIRDDIVFYSLQKGDPAESDLKEFLNSNPNFPLINLCDELTSWTETAAIVDNLDLIISVDTSVIHMAGARGRPVWLLNRLDTCWRWFLRGTTSPWYPSVRIFRQTKPKNWTNVIEDIRSQLITYPTKGT